MYAQHKQETRRGQNTKTDRKREEQNILLWQIGGQFWSINGVVRVHTNGTVSAARYRLDSGIKANAAIALGKTLHFGPAQAPTLHMDAI